MQWAVPMSRERVYQGRGSTKPAEILLGTKGKIAGLIQVGMEDHPRIIKNNTHDKPSQGSEYSFGTLIGLSRKTDESVLVYHPKPFMTNDCGQMIAERCAGAPITDVQPWQS